MSIYQLEPGQIGTSNGPGDAKGLRIGHINARGLKNDEEIEQLEKMMIHHKFDVFGITETHYSAQAQAPNMKGYQQAVLQCRKKCGKKPVWGGVAVYVKEGVDYILKDRQTYSYDEEFEGCIGSEDEKPVQYIHIKVTGGDTRGRIPHIHVVIIYVPPKAVKQLTALVHFLQNKMCGYSSVVVLGDVNVNAFQSTLTHTKKVKESGFGQMITEVTRPGSETLIDHIYVKAFQFSESLSLNVRHMVKHSGVVQTHKTIGDHDLIFCVVKQSYLKRNYENTRAAHNTLLKSIGEAKQQARDDLRKFSIRLLQHLVEAKSPQTKRFPNLSKKEADSLCCGLSIEAYTAMEYYNNMRDKWPTQLEDLHITRGGKNVICLENNSSKELERLLYLCIFSEAPKPELSTMKLDIIDKSSLVEKQWSLEPDKAADKITKSTSRGVGKVLYTVPKSTNHQNYHAYVDSLVSELDVSLTPGERGARTFFEGGERGRILFSAGTKHELTSSLNKIIAVLQQLNPDVSFKSWRFCGEPAVREYVCLSDVKTEMMDNHNLAYNKKL